MAERKQLKAWDEDVALMGPNAPEWNGHITHLIEYLLTVYERFGDTAVTADLQWGGPALHKRDKQKARIAELEADCARLREALEFYAQGTTRERKGFGQVARDALSDAALCDLALRGLASSASATESTPFSGQTHVLKTDPVVFDAVASGHKQFEIRRNDRGFAVGDKLLLRRTRYTGAEMANGKPLDFTGETIAKIVGYMLTGPIYGLEAGWSILGFVPEWHRPEERPPQWTAVGYVDREGVARWELGRGPADHPHGTLLYVVKRPDMNSGLPKEKP